jgi:O-palmitoleoyl-L-serine hydrolase
MDNCISYIILAVLLVLTSADTPYQKIVHKVDAEAKCLDGSPAAIYLHEGDSRNILFYFLGGADCAGKDLSSTLESCYQRSKTIYGSSNYWPETR